MYIPVYIISFIFGLILAIIYTVFKIILPFLPEINFIEWSLDTFASYEIRFNFWKYGQFKTEDEKYRELTDSIRMQRLSEEKKG